MRRRLVLKGALTLGAAVAFPSYAQMTEPLKRGIRVPSGEDRFRKHAPIGASRVIDFKVSGRDTGGRWCSIDAAWHGTGGPPLHVHHDQEEWFYVIEGDYVFQIGDEKFRLTTGDCALAPRQIPHAFVHVREQPARILTVFQPAGDIENFFREYGKLTGATPDQARQFYKSHGLDLLGPPLDVAAMLAYFES